VLERAGIREAPDWRQSPVRIADAVVGHLAQIYVPNVLAPQLDPIRRPLFDAFRLRSVIQLLRRSASRNCC
jgi:hypothetical protein